MVEAFRWDSAGTATGSSGGWGASAEVLAVESLVRSVTTCGASGVLTTTADADLSTSGGGCHGAHPANLYRSGDAIRIEGGDPKRVGALERIV